MAKQDSVILLEIIFENHIFDIIFSEKKDIFFIYYDISIDTKQEQQGTYKKTNECIHDFQ